MTETNLQKNNELVAKKSLKNTIKFLESLLSHIKSNDEGLKAKAMWAAWCLHNYFNNGLMLDIEKALQEHGKVTND